MLAAAALACGARDNTSLIGVSAPRNEREPPAPVDASTSGTAIAASGPRPGMQRVGDRFVSHGHGDAFDAILWANDQARAALEAGVDARDGAMFVEDAVRATPRGEEPEGELAMEKHHGEWQFFVLEADADAATAANPVSCAGCHRDSPHDFVFRPPPARAAPVQMHSAASSAAITATAPTAVAIPAATYDASSAGAAASPSR